MKEATFINWQGHKKSIVKLGNTLTSVVGRSNHGKSSVIRGIKWVQSNSPNGTAFIRKGSKACKVITDSLVHARTKSKNYYKVPGYEEPFKALRSGVPEQVLNYLNLSDDNIQEQQEKTFMLDDTPGKRAIKLSSLIDVDDANAALAHVKKQKEELKARYNTSKLNLERVEFEIKELQVFETIDTKLSLLETKQARIDVLATKASVLSKSIQKAKQTSDRLLQLPDTAALAPAKKLKADLIELKRLISDKNRIQRLVQVVQDNAWHKDVDLLDFRKQCEELKAMCFHARHLNDALTTEKKTRDTYDALVKRKRILEKKKLEIIGEECPLCGKPQ